MITEQQYFQQFFEEVRGTRFEARFYSKLTIHGIVFDCRTFDECMTKAKEYKDYTPCDDAYIEIIESPTGVTSDDIVRLRLDIDNRV